MKKKGYLIALAILITLGLLVWFKEPVAKAVGAFSVNNYVQNPDRTSGAVISTSTLNYLTPGTGTTTVTANTRGTDSVAFNVFVVSSTTATTDIRANVEFSNSTSTVPSQQVWFPQSATLGAASATTTTVTASAKEYRFPAGSLITHYIATSTATNGTFDPTTINMYRVEVNDIKAKWTRLVVYMPTMGNNLTLSTALSDLPAATSTNAGVYLEIGQKDTLSP